MEAVKTYQQSSSLKDRMLTKMAELKLDNTMAAQRLNVSRPYLSRYLNNTYESDPTRIENAIRSFLEENEGKVPAQRLPEKTKFFESNDYATVLAVCEACQRESDLGIITGKPGTGKTHTLKRYAKLPRVAYVECNEIMNPKDTICCIEEALGIPKGKGSVHDRTKNIVNFLQVNRGYLLIIDEADKLINKYTINKIELIRTLSDLAKGEDDEEKVGIIFAGEPVLESMLKRYNDRLADRIGMRHEMGGLDGKEIRDYLKAFNIEENAMQELINRATNKRNGSFRILDRTLRNIIRVLKAKGENQITMEIIKEASNMMM